MIIFKQVERIGTHLYICVQAAIAAHISIAHRLSDTDFSSSRMYIFIFFHSQRDVVSVAVRQHLGVYP